MSGLRRRRSTRDTKSAIPTGRKFGTVEKVFSSEDGEPQYIRVRMGMFGSKTVLLPVNSVAVDDALRDLTLE